MRLLHFDESGRLIQTDFSGRSIPPYAILSHRWGTDEVLFENVLQNSYKSKAAGYQKLLFCSEQARRDQLQYFWIDTCCIDKWNLRELSKAINSMFRWYQNAAKCYVFLTDVSASSAAQGESTWEPSFRASKWFTRGWTLQELLAPVSVEFYSSEWKKLGDKDSLEQIIHEITSIPVDALRNAPLDNFTLPQRMMWAENRETTEKEDSVYCLLGILNIIMQLSYGEGKEKAMERLQQEVEKVNTTPFIVPFNRNDRFVGQESELLKLEERIFSSGQTTEIAITGPGGIGKSQLALEFAYRTKSKYRNTSVLWIPASGIEILHQSCAYIAEKLKIPGWDNEKEDVKKLVQVHLSRTSAGQWLLIYDNADDTRLRTAGLPELQATKLIDYVPQSSLGTIIFTTANYDTAETLAPQSTFKLQEMTLGAAQKILERYLKDSSLINEQQEIKLLLEELSCLPLAIVQAAAYININKTTIKEYRLLLEKQKGAIKLSSGNSEDTSQRHSLIDPISTTWLVSLEQIRRENPLAANYLFFMACIDWKDVPLDILPTAPPNETKDAVDILVAYDLITKRPAESAIDLHRLVHLSAHKWLEEQQWLSQWIRKAIARLLEVFPDVEDESRSKWRRLLPHVKYTLSHGPTRQEDEARTKLAWKCANTLVSDGRYKEAEVLFQEIYQIRTRDLGGDHPDTLTSMSKLSTAFWYQGRWEEAEELDKSVMDARKRVLGKEHPDTLTSITDLASAYRSQDRWNEAEDLDVEVLELRRKLLSKEHPDLLTSMHNLAVTYKEQGRLNEAEQLQRQVAEINEKKLGPDHPNTLRNVGQLASTLVSQGRWNEAEVLFIRVIDSNRRVLGEEHPSTLTGMTSLAKTNRMQGRWKEAEDLELKALNVRKRILGEYHPDVLNNISGLASVYRQQGRLKEAEELDVQVMEITRRAMGEEHPTTLYRMANLSETYMNQGRWKEAENSLVQVLEIRKRVLGEDHPSTLTSMHSLALCCRSLGRLNEAENLQVQVVELGKKKLGKDHLSTIVFIGQLASTYWSQNRLKEAEALEVQVMESYLRVLGKEHPFTLTSIANLASTYLDQGQHKEAEDMFIRVIETRKRVLGEEHPETLVSISGLALTYRRQGQWTKAAELFEKMVEVRRRVLGEKHPSTLTSMKNLAITYKEQGRDEEAIGLMEECVLLKTQVLGADHRDTISSIEALEKGEQTKSQEPLLAEGGLPYLVVHSLSE